MPARRPSPTGLPGGACPRHPQRRSDSRCPDCGIVICGDCGARPLPLEGLPAYCPACLRRPDRCGIDFLTTTARPRRKKTAADPDRQSSRLEALSKAGDSLFVGYCFLDSERECLLLDTSHGTYLVDGVAPARSADVSHRTVRVHGEPGRFRSLPPIPGFRQQHVPTVTVERLERVQAGELLPLEEIATDLDTFDALASRDGVSPRLLTHLAYLYFQGARALPASREPLLAKAVGVLERALGINQRLAIAYHHLALVRSEMGDFGAVVDLCRKALSLNPRLASAYFGLYVAAGQLGHPGEARTALEAAARIGGASLNGRIADLLLETRRSRTALTSIIVSDQRALEHKYGAEGFERIDGALRRLARAHERCGIRSWVDYLPTGAEGPHGMKARLDEVFDSARRAGDPIEYCLLIGGPDVVPFFELTDPTRPEGSPLLSDSPYASGARTGGELIDYLMPTRRLGRIPDEAGAGDPAFLLGLIENAIEFHQRDAAPSWRVFSYTAQAWAPATRRVLECFPQEDLAVQSSEPVRLADFRPEWLAGRQCLHFNLHGSASDSSWKGTGTPVWKRRRALSPEVLPASGTRGAVVFAQCCFGAHITGKEAADSVALSLMAQGARCFVGSLAVAYGVDGVKQVELEESDLIARGFWRHVRRGARFGDALLRAKEEFDEEMIRRAGGLDEDDQKTLLSFVLYGDPTLQLRLEE